MARNADEKKPRGSSPTTQLIRVVVFGGLAVLLILALLDFRAKHQAQATSDAIRKALSSEDAKQDFTKSGIKSIIQGAPIVTDENPQNLQSFGLKSAERFEWKGIFRTYVVTVGYSLGTDPAVEVVQGPGPAE